MNHNKKFSISELQEMRESEDHVELKKEREATFHIMAKAKTNQAKEDVAYLVM